jgi:hypothetical protein
MPQSVIYPFGFGEDECSVCRVDWPCPAVVEMGPHQRIALAIAILTDSKGRPLQGDELDTMILNTAIAAARSVLIGDINE